MIESWNFTLLVVQICASWEALQWKCIAVYGENDQVCSLNGNSVHAVGTVVNHPELYVQYWSSLDDRKPGKFLFLFIPIENVHIQLNESWNTIETGC